jgi:hypothetical protein
MKRLRHPRFEAGLCREHDIGAITALGSTTAANAALISVFAGHGQAELVQYGVADLCG